MKKGLKTLAAIGFSAALMASATLPSVTLASTTNSLDKYKSNSSLTDKSQSKFNQKDLVSDDTFIVKYNKPLSASEHKALGGTQIRQIKELNYAVIKVKNKKNLAKVMKAYYKMGKVDSVSPSVRYQLYGLTDPKAQAQYQNSMLQLEKAQQLAGKNAVTVAVIDTGTDPKHPDLKKNLLTGLNIGNPANQPVTMFHGTHVSGIIAGEKGNGIGGYGVNPNAKILPIDVLDGNDYYLSDYILAAGILEAVNKGAKVINMSLGVGYVSSPLTEEAVRKAIEKGVVVVAAAGNESSDTTSYPAAYEGVLSVGSINSEKKLSSFSNYGPSVDLVAPGEGVYSSVTEPATGKDATFAELSGTSMASPVVAGVASLLLSKHPNLTPAQVEYILEKTADDLGEKGFDTKFANGLVNPVKALSFDIKSIPNYVKEQWTQSEILSKAEEVDATKTITKEAAITKPFEQKWIKFKVKKGEYIQTVLEGSKNYDYKIMANFYGEDKKVESMEVNQSQDGSSEGKLLQAPFDGTVAIGVKDVNGSFDDTQSKASQYKLTVQTAAQLPEDESTLAKMTDIPSLPYQLTTPYRLVGTEDDYDYFKVQVKEKQVVRIDLSGIAGLNTALSVFNLNDILPEEVANELSEDDKQTLLKEMLEGDESSGVATAVGNSGGIGQKEVLTFTAEPNTPYIIKVAGNATDESNFLEFLLSLLLGQDFSMTSKEKAASLIPYSINVQGKVLPEDEDGLNMNSFNQEGEVSAETTAIATTEEKNEVIKSASDPYLEELSKQTKTILDQGIPYELGKSAKGYIQDNEDQDYFVVKPKETGIYEFNLTNKDGSIPMTDIAEAVQMQDDEGKPFWSTSYIGDNSDFSGMNISTKSTFYTGLEAGKTYILTLYNFTMNGSSNISYEPYEMNSKKLVANPSDAYEPSDMLNVKNLPNSTFTANFAMPNDVDPYYYVAKESGVKSISIGVGKATEEMKAKYPAELFDPYYGVATVIEDSNGNHKFDLDDAEIQIIQKGPADFSAGSFKAQKGKGYFFVVEGNMLGNTPFSLIPYTFNIADANKKDEVSSQAKPLYMKTTGKIKERSGYFNAGITGGDEDWYQFELTKSETVTVKLEAGKETDGVISLYQNGKLLKNSDLYLQADTEEFQMTLPKGKYQVKVNDANGAASVTPYTLKIVLP